MNTVEMFLDAILEPVENQFIVGTRRWKGKDGKPLLWEIKAVPEAEIKALKLEANRRANAEHLMRTKMFKSSKNKEAEEVETIVSQSNLTQIFNLLLAVASTVSPDLNNAQLQDKFGVHTAEDLLKAILSIDGEYTDYLQKVAAINGYAEDNYAEAYEEAKND